MSTSGGSTGTGTISDITSTGNTIAVTDAAGPTTNLEVGTYYPDLAEVVSFITVDQTIAATGETNITSVVLAAGTWLIIGKINIQNSDTTAAHYVETFLGPTSASLTGAYCSGACFPSENGLTTTGHVSEATCMTVQTFAVQTTVYLEATGGSGANVIAKAATEVNTIGDQTGIVAIRIA